MSNSNEFLDSGGKLVLAIATSVLVIGFGIYALLVSWSKQGQHPESNNLEFFLTARNTQPILRVAWSFVAGAMGAWILTSPSSVAEDSGILGVISYAIFAGLPIFLVALVGARVQEVLPNVLSFSDYIYHRFGFAPQLYVTLIILLNLGIALTAEYTAISGIFEACLGNSNYPIAIGIAVVTAAYTACGGLFVSILTDQYQAIFGMLLLSVLTLTLSISFRPSLDSLPPNLSPNVNGYSMMLIMPITLTCATVFGEAPWQRIWASESSSVLRKGSLLASFIVSLVVFIFGMIGFFANWAGYIHKTTDLNLAIFALVAKNYGQWLVILLAILAVVLCESAVDTLQNALVSTISTMVLRNQAIRWTRLMVLLLNIPPLVISYYKYDTFLLLQIGNKIACTAAIPMVLGFYFPALEIVTGPCVIFASFFSLVCIMLFGFIYKASISLSALQFSFADPFDPFSVLVAILSSVIGIFLWIGLINLFTYFNLPLNELSCFCPGYKANASKCYSIPDAENSPLDSPKDRQVSL